MVGFETGQEISKEEFEAVVLPAVLELIQRTGELNFLLVLHAEFESFVLGAWLKETMKSLDYMSKWNRVAVITNTIVINSFSDLLAHIKPGEFRGFNKSELPDAIHWVGGQDKISNKKTINQI